MHDAILLVEDDPTDVELTLRALGRHNLTQHVVVASDGAEALEIMFGPVAETDHRTRALPRLVLLDLKLPKVDGIEVLRRLKAHEETRCIPVVVLTSSAEPSDLRRTYGLGVNSYVVKPVDFDQYVEALAFIGRYWATVNRTPYGS